MDAGIQVRRKPSTATGGFGAAKMGGAAEPPRGARSARLGALATPLEGAQISLSDFAEEHGDRGVVAQLRRPQRRDPEASPRDLDVALVRALRRLFEQAQTLERLSVDIRAQERRAVGLAALEDEHVSDRHRL